MKTLFETLKRFLTHNIWQIQLKNLSRWKQPWYKLIRICVISYQRYIDIRFDLRASSLTFYTILSIVPVFAVFFGIAKGFGIQNAIAEYLVLAFPGQEVVIEQIADISKNMIDNTSGGLIAGLGLILLFWSVIKVMNSIEESFNDVWDIPESRSWARKFTDYFSIILIGPFLLIITGGVNVFIRTQIEDFFELIGFFGYIAGVTDISIDLIPVAILGLLFSLFYVIVPNTKVNFKSAFYAGLLAGLAFQILQILYFEFQIGVSRTNAIYGSLAAIPLFFIWLQISWRIVILGGIISYSHQHLGQYVNKINLLELTPFQTKIASIRLLQIVLEHHINQKEPLTLMELSEKLYQTPGTIRQLIHALMNSGLLYQVNHDGRTIYVPALNSDAYTLAEIDLRLDKRIINNSTKSEKKLEALNELKACFEQFREGEKKIKSNRHILNVPIK